jgi:hypothetical protein
VDVHVDKEILDEKLGVESSAVVISTSASDDYECKQKWALDKSGDLIVPIFVFASGFKKRVSWLLRWTSRWRATT